MSLFRKRPAPESQASQADPAAGQESDFTPVPGERGIPSINRERSLQSRLSSVLALTLMSLLGGGLLIWYYAHALTRQAQAQKTLQARSSARAQGDVPLPPLGPLSPPTPPPHPAETSTSLADRVLGPAPQPPDTPAAPIPTPAVTSAAAPQRVAAYTAQQKSPGQLAFERRLSGPVFAHSSFSSPGGPPNVSDTPSLSEIPPSASLMPAASSEGRATAPRPADGDLSSLLQPVATAPAVFPTLLPARRFLLSKGAFIDCTLETAIDSTLPGVTTCITATDTYSTDGSVVLLERGTKLVGETRGQVGQGAARIFVLWTEARTPTGVVVPLASPGTDELGRSGLPAHVDRHFWDRFGAAILLSIVNGAVQAGIQAASHNNGSSVIVNPSATTDVMTEVLHSTVAIPPTLTKQQGDRIQVLVARDVDFRSVYELRMTASAGKSERP